MEEKFAKFQFLESSASEKYVSTPEGQDHDNDAEEKRLEIQTRRSMFACNGSNDAGRISSQLEMCLEEEKIGRLDRILFRNKAVNMQKCKGKKVLVKVFCGMQKNVKKYWNVDATEKSFGDLTF